MSVEQEFLTVREVAQISGAERPYIRLLVSKRVLRSKLFHGRRFIERESFEKWNQGYKIRRHIQPASVEVSAGKI